MSAAGLRPAWCFLVLVLMLLSPPAKAQLGGLAQGDGPSLPIEILADDGIEWQQEQSLVRARGNARAIRGDVELKADELTAFYREAADGSNEVWRLEADGGVVITSPTEAAYADKAIYDIDNAVMVLKRLDTSERVRLVGEKGVISADDQMEYWETKQMVVARGDAVAEQEDRTLRANVLVAYLHETEGEGTQIERVEAFDQVEIITPREDVRADRGVYRAGDETASLLGSVKITRGKNQLNGCRAEVDLAQGLSTLFGCSDGSTGRSQVRGLIQPEEGAGDGKRN